MRKLLNEELDRLDVPQFRASEKIPVAVILDNVRSMNNIGSVFRTSDAFRIERIALCGITATPPHKEIHKTALGATESVAWNYFEQTLDAVNQYRSEGYLICSIEQAKGSYMMESFPIDFEKKYALIFGHEVRGVEQEVVNHSDCCIEIPQFGTKHSLNISVSAGIILWEFFKKLRSHIL
ncbi:MAG: RNA methyltransferase [Bacteroidales bacterium]|nr:RNA methyltransferase [Bacteroidales bacterium]